MTKYKPIHALVSSGMVITSWAIDLLFIVRYKLHGVDRHAFLFLSTFSLVHSKSTLHVIFDRTKQEVSSMKPSHKLNLGHDILSYLGMKKIHDIYMRYTLKKIN